MGSECEKKTTKYVYRHLPKIRTSPSQDPKPCTYTKCNIKQFLFLSLNRITPLFQSRYFTCNCSLNAHEIGHNCMRFIVIGDVCEKYRDIAVCIS